MKSFLNYIASILLGYVIKHKHYKESPKQTCIELLPTLFLINQRVVESNQTKQ